MLFKENSNETGTGKNGVLYIMPNTSHCNLCSNLKQDWEFNEQLFCTSPGKLIGELIVISMRDSGPV